jgi:hypothetical protein
VPFDLQNDSQTGSRRWSGFADIYQDGGNEQTFDSRGLQVIAADPRRAGFMLESRDMATQGAA